MSPDGPGSIRVFIRWHDQTVFAGEEVKCTITFKNVARPPGSAANSSSKSSARNPPVAGQTSPLHGQNARKSPSALAPPPVARGHRASLSLSVPSAAAASRARAGSIPWSPQTPQDSRARNGQVPGAAPGSSHGNGNNGGNGPGNGRGNGHSHKRSLSIVSMGSATVSEPQTSTGSMKSQRPARGHARASSLQIVPRGGGVNSVNGPRSASHIHRPFTSQPSPLFNSSYPPDRNTFPGRSSGASTVPNTPGVGVSIVSPRSASGSDTIPEFRFPMGQSPRQESKGVPSRTSPDRLTSPLSAPGESSALPTRGKDTVPTISEHPAAPAARILSTTSVAGTPRSSGEFYSISNNSTETLASEYVTQQPVRSQGRPPHFRRMSNFSNSGSTRLPEALMMGYAQIQGSFTLDGSLVNLGPFEQVKRKAVVGGQGGGVIGVESSKRDSGLLRGFGWGSLTNSIGELLGGGELSSIKEMRGIASSKAIPLLSTPQSILFVDLKLAPGESKTYEYVFRLPKGLPPTHRGKAMKISYSLVIGTQRPGGAKEQQVTSVEIPFRVLGSVNDHGEILGHDLMNPYIILRDQARVQSVSKPHNQNDTTLKDRLPIDAPSSTLNSFLSYADELLSRRSNDTGGPGFLSPTAVPSSRRESTISTFYPSTPTAKEAIDLAILRSNITTSQSSSFNRFEIARNGRRVGVVTLARPAYRLGESVTLAVDFAGAEVLCLAVHAALETAERIVDPGLALRSEASVHRVTKKVYVAASEATMYARRMVFSPTIPVTATPEFVTSGIALEWKVRLEFVVPVQDEGERERGQDGREGDIEEEDEDGEDGQGEGEGGHPHGQGRRLLVQQQQQQQQINSNASNQAHPLLEEISRDDRGGLVLVAAENLACESFEVAVPLRVYGAVCTGLERLERDEALEEGLVV